MRLRGELTKILETLGSKWSVVEQAVSQYQRALEGGNLKQAYKTWKAHSLEKVVTLNYQLPKERLLYLLKARKYHKMVPFIESLTQSKRLKCFYGWELLAGLTENFPESCPAF